MSGRGTEPKAPSPIRWRAFLVVVRQAILMVAAWIKRECERMDREGT